MNLTQLRALTNTPKTAFDFRRSKGAYVWLDKYSEITESLGGGKREKYTLAHAVGMDVMNRVLAKGGSLECAGYMASFAWQGIRSALDSGDLSPVGTYAEDFSEHLFVGWVTTFEGDVYPIAAAPISTFIEKLNWFSRGNDPESPKAPDGLFMQDITLVYRHLHAKLNAGLGDLERHLDQTDAAA